MLWMAKSDDRGFRSHGVVHAACRKSNVESVLGQAKNLFVEVVSL